MKVSFLIIIVSFLMIGCQKEDTLNSYTVLEACIDKVEVNDTLIGINKEHIININYKVSGCYTYMNHEEIKGNNTSTFKVFIYNPYEFDTEKACFTGIFNEHNSIKFRPLASGEYTLFFNDSSLVKRVMVLE